MLSSARGVVALIRRPRASAGRLIERSPISTDSRSALSPCFLADLMLSAGSFRPAARAT